MRHILPIDDVISVLHSEALMFSSGSFRDLRVWQAAMKLTREIYKETAKFPRHELYGLTQQIRRAAVSAPSNIAEGKGRHSDKEFAPLSV
jgi:23S rRNA-intervening sequence protein